MQREYQKPRVGISSCLLGERVRYDGGHKRDAWLVDVLGRDVEWVPVCPEIEAGFGTPREPVDLMRGADGVRRLIAVRTNRDVTAPMRRFIERRIEELAAARLSGYVLKAGSPSCGLDDVDPGLFAEALLARFPDLPIEDERRLADPERRRQFVDRVFAYYRDCSTQ
jgi:uncharacterized protein YbbK (DUF523 family)